MISSLQQTLIFIPKAILIIGIIGNICNMIVFGKRTMRSLSTFRFLFYLSIVDMLVLLFGAMDMLIRIDFSLDWRDFSLIACNFQKFLTYTCTYVSSFISVAVNIDRAQIVSGISMFHMNNTNRLKNNTLKKKFKRSVRLNKRFVDYIVIVIVVSLTVLNLHYVTFLETSSIIYIDNEGEYYDEIDNINSTIIRKFVARRFNASIMKNQDEKIQVFLKEPHKFEIKTCMPIKGSLYESFMLNIWLWVDIVLYSIVPIVSMAVCTTIIILKINKINRSYLRQFFTSITVTNSNVASSLIANTISLSLSSSINKSTHLTSHTKLIYLKKLKKNFQICVMLISSNLYFLATMLIFWTWYLFRYEKNETLHRNLTHSYVYVLLYTNNAFGFVFYGFSSEKYRREFVKTFSRPAPKIQRTRV